MVMINKEHLDVAKNLKTAVRICDRNLKELAKAADVIIPAEGMDHGVLFFIDPEWSWMKELVNGFKKYAPESWVESGEWFIGFVSLSKVSRDGLISAQLQMHNVSTIVHSDAIPKDARPTKNKWLFRTDNHFYISNGRPTPTEPKGFSDFAKTFKGHDWYYTFSDDIRAYNAGEKSLKERTSKFLDMGYTIQELDACFLYNREMDIV